MFDRVLYNPLIVHWVMTKISRGVSRTPGNIKNEVLKSLNYYYKALLLRCSKESWKHFSNHKGNQAIISAENLFILGWEP